MHSGSRMRSVSPRDVPLVIAVATPARRSATARTTCNTIATAALIIITSYARMGL